MTQSGSAWTASGSDHREPGWESRPHPACVCHRLLMRSWREPTWSMTAHWKGDLWGMLEQPEHTHTHTGDECTSDLPVHIIFVILNPPHCLYSRRSNSICKSPGPNSPKETPFITRDIGRSESLRSASSCSHRIFRPCDLIHGEILGKGFFGQAIKVSLLSYYYRAVLFWFPHATDLMCCFCPTNRWLTKPRERWWWWRSWSGVMRRPRRRSWRRLVFSHRQNRVALLCMELWFIIPMTESMLHVQPPVPYYFVGFATVWWENMRQV